MGWERLDEIPKGWRIDKTAGSPVCGYVFVTNGKSLLNGQKRALLRVKHPQVAMFAGQDYTMPAPAHKQRDEAPVIDATYCRTVNELAREKFKHRLLADILIDLQVCEIEGWSKLEYINQLRDLINGIADKNCIDG